MPRDKPKRADEVLAEVEQDPQFRNAAERSATAERVALDEYRVACAPLLAELASLGYPVSRVGDLVNGNFEYASAVPLLVKWLPRLDNLRVKEDIVRTLSAPSARGPATSAALIGEFKIGDDPTGAYYWAVANALSVVADKRDFDQLLELARDRRYGRAREMLTLAIARTNHPDAPRALVEFLQDDEIAGHAVKALGILAAPETRAALVPFVQHRTPWVRNAAKSAMKKIDRGGSSSGP